MAKKKSEKKPTNLHKQIEAEVDDPAERAGRVGRETSSDGRFSIYERVKVPGGELIQQFRGAPKK